MRRLVLVLALGLLLALAAFASVAAADHGPLPWSGGQAARTPFEDRMTAMAVDLSKRGDAIAHCHGETDWNVLAGQGRFNPTTVLAFVPIRFIWILGVYPIGGYYWIWGIRVPAGTEYYMHVSPTTCWYADEFLGAASKSTQKWCTSTRSEWVTATVTEYVTEVTQKPVIKRKRVWTTVAVRKKGKVKRVRKQVWRTYREWIDVEKEVPHEVEETSLQEVTVDEECKDWMPKVLALETFVHEAMHISGVRDEAAADCYAMQYLAWAAWKYYGADPAFAHEIANDYWTREYPTNQGTEYWSPECRNGGRLDLRPETDSWP